MQHKIMYVDPESLNPAPYNPRTISDDSLYRLAGLLDAHGFVDPVIARGKDRLLIGGHQRLKANQLRKKPDKKIPCVFLDVDDRQAKALNIALNNERAQGQFDDNMLAELLQELDKYDDLDLLTETGISEDELLDILGDGGTEGQTAEDAVPDPPKKPKSKLGKLYLFGDHRLFCGDSTQTEDVAILMDGQKADICFTSPPYNAGNNSLGGNKKMKSSKYLHDTDNKKNREWLSLISHVLVNMQTVAVNQVFNIQHLTNNKIELIEFLYAFRHQLVDTSIWFKGGGQPAMVSSVMNSRFEYVFIFTGEDKAKRKIKSSYFRNVSNVFELNPSGKNRNNDIHAATFPVEFAAHYVSFLSKSSVLDPFLGSGTTLIACEKLRRKCYGMELDPVYCDVTRKRWAEYVHGPDCDWQSLTPAQ